MIPPPVLTQWRRQHPWSTEEQVEQDLLLSQLAILLASHDELGRCLVWRGGTCLHKLHLIRARRSRRISTMCSSAAPDQPAGLLTPFGPRWVEQALLKEVSRNVVHGSVKILLEGEANSGVRLRVKIEINTDEVPPALALTRIAHSVETHWWSGEAGIPTFQPGELVGVKVPCLCAGRGGKGRDLWDMWLARRELPVYRRYRPGRCGLPLLSACGVSPATFRQRLWANAADQQFREDL